MPESEGTKGAKLEDGVSVIVPCYYDWKRVKPCLDAIRKQTGVAIQLILVYNKQPGTDPKDTLKNGLVAYAKKYNEENKESSCVVIYPDVKKYKSYNYSASAARNLGLQFVNKTTIMFIDDDDIIGWKPTSYSKNRIRIDSNYLKRFYDALFVDDGNGNKIATDVSMAIGDIISSEIKKGSIIPDRPLGQEGFKNYDAKKWSENLGLSYEDGVPFLYNRPTACATLFRTDIVNDSNYKLQFDSDRKYREDTKFVIKYILKALTQTRFKNKSQNKNSDESVPINNEWGREYKSMLEGGNALKRLTPLKKSSNLQGYAIKYDNALRSTGLPKQIGNLIKAPRSFYAYIQHPDSVMGQTEQKSQNKWENQFKRHQDNLHLYTWELLTVTQAQTWWKEKQNTKHPLYNVFKGMYVHAITEYLNTLKAIKDDIDRIFSDQQMDIGVAMQYNKLLQDHMKAFERRLAALGILNADKEFQNEFMGKGMPFSFKNKYQEFKKDANNINAQIEPYKTQCFKKAKSVIIDSVNSNANIPQQDDSGYEY